MLVNMMGKSSSSMYGGVNNFGSKTNETPKLSDLVGQEVAKDMGGGCFLEQYACWPKIFNPSFSIR